MARLSIRVIPNASRTEVVERGDDHWKIKLKAVPAEGKANRALIELLAKEFGVSKKSFAIVSGEKSRQKIVEW